MAIPNVMHNNKWKLGFSNFPSLVDKKINFSLFEEYVKTLTIPDMTVETINSDFLDSSIRHPISRNNDDLNVLNIDFVTSEDLQNYLYFYNWIQMLRYGETNETIFRNTTIKSIDVELLDNQKRVKARLRFTNVILTDLGSLTLNFGTADELVFSTSFTYEQLDMVV